MGESIMEATILKWVKKVGDSVKMDETILEIATDKVDSEIPSPVEGILTEIKFQENDVVEIGKVIAILQTGGKQEAAVAAPSASAAESKTVAAVQNTAASAPAAQAPVQSSDSRFYSPLVKNIAKEENISQQELNAIAGTGQEGRVTKKDMIQYLENRGSGAVQQTSAPQTQTPVQESSRLEPARTAPSQSMSGNVEIIEMDRMRKLIAEHMVNSKRISPHVTSYIEVDVTNIVNWREKAKKQYEIKYNEKITFTPIFIEAVVKAIRDFPMINVSVEGDKIIRKKDINIGMAAALPSGNLIVPVIKNADLLNLAGLTKSVNDFATRARANQLKPDEISGGTFTLTNVGTFGNVMGTPIINQPQVAILAVGAIRKKPAVMETEFGDVIAIRQLMFLSLSYDHRVVDGSLGGTFLRRIGDYLEKFDHHQTV